MGDIEDRAPALLESPLGYHPWNMKVLTCTRESGWGTLSGGQFDWGGRLQKGNGGNGMQVSSTGVYQSALMVTMLFSTEAVGLAKPDKLKNA